MFDTQDTSSETLRKYLGVGVKQKGRRFLRGGREMNTGNPQIDTKTTKQIRLDSGVHKILKIEASRAGKSIKEYLEDHLTDIWYEEGVKWE